MRLVKAIVFVSNLLGLLIINIYLWTVAWSWGLGGLIGIVGFFVGYKLSDGMTIVPRDYWRNSSYEIFKKKLAYGNSIAAATGVIASFILMALDALI